MVYAAKASLFGRAWVGKAPGSSKRLELVDLPASRTVAPTAHGAA